MVDRAVARADVDRADKIIVSGTKTVLTNNKKTATEGSVTQSGNAVTEGDTTVFAENKKVARAGDNTAKNVPIVAGSTNVFADDNNNISIEVFQNDDIDDGTPSGQARAFAFVQSLVQRGYIPQSTADKIINNAAAPQFTDPPYTPVTGNVVVLLFRGINDKPGYEKSSVGVDLTAEAINKISGYRAKVFNYTEAALAQKEIKPNESVILYGFSAGGETVRRFATELYPSQKIALVLILDTYPKPINFISQLPGNVDRGINWYNPKWGYLNGLAPSGTTGKGQHIQDPTSPPSNAAHFNFPQKHLQDVLTAIQTVKSTPVPQTVNTTVSGANPNGGGAGGYNKPWPGIVGASSFPTSMQISPNFTLGDLTQSLKGKTQWSRSPLAPVGNISVETIVSNLSCLAQNIVEPLYKQFPDMYFTSTNRPYTGNPTSQHPLGQACDVQFSSGNTYKQILPRIQWVLDNLPFDQLILETNGKAGSYWMHISYNPRGSRAKTDPYKYFTMVQGTAWKQSRRFVDFYAK
jgi:uncharacterized Zn-binding protein involved in type VI secretion